MVSLIVVIGLGVLFFNIFLLWYAKRSMEKSNTMLSEAKDRLKNAKRDIESERREALLKVKDDVYKRRHEFEHDMKRERSDVDRLHARLNTKYEVIEKKEQHVDDLRRDLQQKERGLLRTEDSLRSEGNKLKNLYNELVTKLERLSNMTQDEAKQALFDTLSSEVKLSSQKWIQKIEDEAKQQAKNKSRSIIITAMQRYAAEQVVPHASGIVHLPSDEMKGRIIGKEGRNIKALEMATGMEFVIGDTPEVITISGFNPIRREIARRSLDRLIADGRINPTRIEETVQKCETELDEIIQDYGNQAVLELNLQSVAPEIITLLGKLHFRTSFSQNVLLHSKEVAIMARMIAEELGLDGSIALRAGLFHDIGKAVSAEVEGPHAQTGGEVLRRCGESKIIVNAVESHHEESSFISPYAPILLIADTISASRPGARRETLTTYLKRLSRLEEIANSFDGVKKAYALQAGREVRIIVEEDRLTDDQSRDLARDIAKKVEDEMNFPGQIKINVIREKRSIEYAR
ncbi:ribonuclease Y [bacterium]|nr:ribonuclease Y [bacterium]